MTREERIDWMCRLRCWVVAPPLMTAEQKSKFIEALTETIKALQTEQKAYTEGYDACKRIMARKKQFNSYCPKCMGKLEHCEDAISRSELLKAIDTWDKFGFEHTGCFVREPKDDFVTYVHYDDVVKCIKGMPSVQPEPFINKPCVSEQACNEDKMKVLGKIRERIELEKLGYTPSSGYYKAIIKCLQIIDKYKSESEGKE